MVWGAYDLVALRGTDGSVLWRNTSLSTRVFGGPVLADLDGDGAPEIAAGRGTSGQVMILGLGGASRWTGAAFTSGEVRSLAAARVSGRTGYDLVAGRAGSGATGQVAVLNASGSILAGWPSLHSGSASVGGGIYGQSIATADLNSDGRAEIVAPTDAPYILALGADGNDLPASSHFGAGKVFGQVPVHTTDAGAVSGTTNCATDQLLHFSSSPASIGDLDGDGTLEIVVVGSVYDCSTNPYTDLYHVPVILKADRTRLKTTTSDWTVLPVPPSGAAPKSQDSSVIEMAMPNPVLVDLDGDGKKEILYASYDGRVHAWWLDRTEHGSWPYTVPGSGIRFASEPVVADLDGDGKSEVIFTTWPEKASGASGSLIILDWQGRLVYSVELPPAFPAPGWNGGLGAPTLARLGTSTELAVVVGTARSGVVAYRIPGSVATGIRWGTGRGNYRRDGTGP